MWLGHRPQTTTLAPFPDVSTDGAVCTPTTAVSRKAFDSVFELVDRELTFCEGVLDQATPQQLGATFGSMRTSGRARAMRGSIAEPGPEAGLALAIALRAGIDADGAVDFAKEASRIFGRLQPPEAGYE